MSFPRVRSLRRRLRRVVAVTDDRYWVVLPLVVATVVAVAYLLTHPYPAYGAGLYLESAARIRANGYALPTRIPGYTADGIPFAYPPLQFYVAAVVRDLTGVGALAYARYFPAFLTVCYLVPYYGIARELLATPRRAAVATLLLAVTPPVLQWHLSAGGIVRSGAFLLTLTGTYVGIRLFRTGDRRWLAAAVPLFALTLLAHPVYAMFFGVSYLLVYATVDRTRRGLGHGAVVAVGGLLAVSPWLGVVVERHGLGVFRSASATHGGVGGGGAELLTVLTDPTALTADGVFALLALLGAAWLVADRRPLLPVWTVVAGIMFADSRFLFVPGVLMGTVVLFDLVLPAVRRLAGTNHRQASSRVVLSAVVVIAVVTGVLFATSAADLHAGDTAQPQFIDGHDRAAMEWAETRTRPSAEFVVLGDAAEWFPYFTDRTILLGPWGVEWDSPERYRFQLSTYRSLSNCETSRCLTTGLDRAGLDPEYVYVPKDHYTVRGFDRTQSPSMQRTLDRSDRYEQRYENEGVVVYEVVTPTDEQATRAGPSPTGAMSWRAVADRRLRTADTAKETATDQATGE